MKGILPLQCNNLLEEAFQHGHLHPAISQGQVNSHESCLSLLSISKGLQRGLQHDSLFCRVQEQLKNLLNKLNIDNEPSSCLLDVHTMLLLSECCYIQP